MENIVYRFCENDGVITAFAHGFIDTSNYVDFLNQFDGADVDKELVLDMEKIEYISSAGIRAVLILAKKFTRGFSVINANESVIMVFETTGLSKHLVIKPSENSNAVRAEGTFEDILKTKVSANPDRVFVVYNDEKYTFGDIDKISRIIASDLMKQGVRRYSHVGIYAEDSINFVCAFFAIQKLGAVAALLNPSYTSGEIAALSKEGDITHLCYAIDGENAEGFLKGVMADGSLIKYTCNIGRDVDFRRRYDEYETVKLVNFEKHEADDPCVMIFTSGSTGTPKGALHSYYTLKVGGAHMNERQKIISGDRFCHVMPFFHVGGLCFDLMSALLADGEIYFPDYTGCSNIVDRMNRILNTIEKYQCTVFNAVPTSLLSVAGLDEFSCEKIKSVRCIATGSQPITEQQMKFMLEKYKGILITVIYGMTEFIPVTYVNSDDTVENLIFTIGKPVKNVNVDILDNDGNVCKVGETGEINVAGDHAIACYYKMAPEKQPVNNMGYIKTGDLGFFDADGYLHFVGRSKDIIIRGGENIVPGEISGMISNLEYISDVYVCGVPDTLMGEKVAAAIIMKPGYEFDKDKIKKELGIHLAKHKIPSYFKVLDAFPLLANGKLDKVRLKKMLEQSV